MARRAVVEAGPASPPRVGLLASLGRAVFESDPGNPDTGRWEDGFMLRPERCVSSGVGDICDIDDLPIDDPKAAIEYEPFFVYAGFRCGTLSYRGPADYVRRAREALEACQSEQIEHELWTGALAAAADPDWPNPVLASADADIVTAAATEAVTALAVLEQALADCGMCGQRGMIHAPRSVVTLWANGGALRREGSTLYTIHDTIVVPGSGYTGSSPAGVAAADGAVWAYGTGMVDVRLGAIEAIPMGEGDSAMAQATDRTTNTTVFRAARRAAALFDPCCHVAAEVDAPVPA